MPNNKTIAFYLPQFYPTPENDEWWGKGFTEWTNVAKAQPLYPGHYQPRVPADLGFYDLRMPSVREEQAELAKRAGIHGFCYWHYWFAGKRLLDTVFSEVVSSGKPDFPFCLCWANHSWFKKTWSANQPNTLLIEQTYPGIDDYINHFNEMLPAFKDDRYIKVNGKLLFGVYEPTRIPDTQLFFDTWNNLAKENGLNGFCFFGFVQGRGKELDTIKLGYDKVVYDCLMDVYSDMPGESRLSLAFARLKRKLHGYPITVKYQNYADYACRFYTGHPEWIPCIDPDFDHSPRSGARWLIMHGSTPNIWGKLYKSIAKLTEQRDDSLLFIKSWNEWGEGNYLEPDMKWGRDYLNVMGLSSDKIEE